MEQIVLGLLFLCDRTIYQLRSRIDKGLSLMYSSSMGSIQAAIKKLLQAGYIEYQEIVENGKYKKMYHITENGKRYFLDWINAPIGEVNVRCPELVKIYFMGFSDKGKREVNIQSYLASMKEKYRVLKAICDEAEHMDVPEEGKDIFQYQLVSALYGKALCQFNINWYEQLLEQMRNW